MKENKETKRAVTFKFSEEAIQRLSELTETLTRELGFKVSRSSALELAIKEALANRVRISVGA